MKKWLKSHFFCLKILWRNSYTIDGDFMFFKNIEYTTMASFYDDFYSKKDYKKEVEFILNFANGKSSCILDAGCGTGNHAKLLGNLGYRVKGFDKSEEMVAVANCKMPNTFSVGDVLNYNDGEKYDLIISFFAVFNHLKNYKKVKIALINLKKNLKENGKIILDLHNPQSDGKKIDEVNNGVRVMKWRCCKLLKKEFSKITYKCDGGVFKTKHVFKIFDLDKLKKIAYSVGFAKVNLYENYNVGKEGAITSKNIQLVLFLEN